MEMAGWLHTHKILKLEVKSRSDWGWGGKNRTEETKRSRLCILASCDAFIRPLLPTEYLEEQPCVFLDSWQTSRFGSFWEVSEGLAALQNLSEPSWFGNRATNLFKIWLAQDFASVSISSARPASPQTQPFSQYFGTSISSQAWAREVQRRLKIQNWVRKSWDQRPNFWMAKEGLSLVQEGHFLSEQIHTFLGKLRSDWRLHFEKVSGISKLFVFSLGSKPKCFLIF